MFHRFIIAALTLFVSFPAFTQEEEQKTKYFDILIIAGPGMSNFQKNDFSEEFKYGFGYNAGANIEHHIAKNISLVSGLQWEHKVVKLQFEFQFINEDLEPEIVSVDDRFKFNYLVVPVLARIYLGQSKARVYVNAGFHLDILLGAKFNDENVTSSYNSLDYGLAGGIGVRFPVSDTNDLLIEVRDHLGLSNIVKDGLERKLNSINLFLALSI